MFSLVASTTACPITNTDPFDASATGTHFSIIISARVYTPMSSQIFHNSVVNMRVRFDQTRVGIRSIFRPLSNPKSLSNSTT
eukprot:1335341-Amorphochlora_amoeboformis.AAC.3